MLWRCSSTLSFHSTRWKRRVQSVVYEMLIEHLCGGIVEARRSTMWKLSRGCVVGGTRAR